MMGPGEDEFEFKPLTAGLGFDQKTKGLRPAPARTSPESAPRALNREADAVSVPAGKKESSVAAQKVSQIISSLPSLDFLDSTPTPKKTPVISPSPLPRPQQNAGPLLGDIPGLPKRDRQGSGAIAPQQSVGLQGPMPATLPVAPAAARVQTSDNRNVGAPIQNKASFGVAPGLPVTASTPPKAPVSNLETPDVRPSEMQLTEIPFHMGAAIFDMLVVVGLTCLFAVALLLITGTDLNIILLNAKTDLATQLGIGLLVLSVFALYSVIGRAFCGMTLGEWTFDLQVGSDGEQMKAWYPLAITLRWVLLVVTGLFLFPLLSAIFGKDLLGRMTGAKLYQLGPASR